MDTSLFDGNIVQSERIIYTPSAFAKNNLLYLQEIGELKAKEPHTNQRNHLASYLFFIVLEGSGVIQYNNTMFSLKKYDCVFLDCQQPYYHRSSDDLWKLKWVHFNGTNMPGIYEKYIQRGGLPCFHSNKILPYSSLLQELYEIASSELYVRDMKIYEKLTSLLTLLMEESWNQADIHSSKAQKGHNLQPIKDYLEQHYMDKITLDTLATQFFINKYYLTRIFKSKFGISINNYLLQVRITHAKHLLRFTDLPIEEIGRQCGIQDSNYFSRTFRKIEGISPGSFRRMWKK